MAQYYACYPADVERISTVADILAGGTILLPDGDLLSVRRFQSTGIYLGRAPGHDNIHWLVDEAIAAPGRLSDHFLAAVMTLTTYDGDPLLAGLQESIYAHAGNGATGWAAAAEQALHPECAPEARSLVLTEEMMFPWMFQEIRALRPFEPAVEALAKRSVHSPLYDPARLRSNDIPVSAVIYFDDFYVAAGLSLETAAAVGNLTHWVTNEFEHDGIRQDTAVVKRLLAMVVELGGPKR
jgi:hypothetical protein